MSTVIARSCWFTAALGTRASQMSDDERQSRARFKGSINSVVDIISRHAANPAFLPYDDNPKAQVDVKKLAKNKEMWKELHTLFPPLSFTKSFVSQVFNDLVEEKKWDLRGAEKDSFVSTLTARFRMQARHLKQSQCKKRQWISEFGLDQTVAVATGGSAVITADGEAAAPTTASAGTTLEAPAAPAAASQGASYTDEVADTVGDYVVGFDPEQMKAWRQPRGSKVKEFADDHIIPIELQMNIKATWADGTSAEVPNTPARLFHDLADEKSDSSHLGKYCGVSKQAKCQSKGAHGNDHLRNVKW